MLEVQSEFGGDGSWRNVMCPAECGQKIVKRVFIGDVDHGDPRAYLEAVVSERKQIVIAHRDIKQIALSDPRRVLVIVFRVWCRN